MFPAIAVLSLLTAACGDGDRTDCAIAKENLDQCMVEVVVAPNVASYQRLPLTIGDDCSGENACVARCVKNASCEAMRWVLFGRPVDPDLNPSLEAVQSSGKIDLCLSMCIRAPNP